MHGRENLGFCCGIEADGSFWFPSVVGNALMRRKDGKTVYIGNFPEETYEYLPLYSRVQLYKKMLIFIPWSAKKICTYNMETGEFSAIPWKGITEIADEPFRNAVIKEQYMYLFAGTYNGILKINLENWDMELQDEWIKKMPPVLHPERAWFASGYCVVGENKIYLASEKTNAVMLYDLSDENYYIWQVGDSVYLSMAYDGADFWLAPYGGESIIRWNSCSGMVQKYNCFSENHITSSYYSALVCDGVCWFFPIAANAMVLKIRTTTEEFSEDVSLAGFCKREDSTDTVWPGTVIFCEQKDGKIWLQIGYTADVICYDVETEKLDVVTFEKPAEWDFSYGEVLQKNYERRQAELLKLKKKWYLDWAKKKGYFDEGRVSLQEYIQVSRKNIKEEKIENIGVKILDWIK